jgi:hypothetical protein
MASPTVDHPGGGDMVVQLFVAGLYIDPFFWSTSEQPDEHSYSPPMIITLPSGSTADEKYRGAYPDCIEAIKAHVPPT